MFCFLLIIDIYNCYSYMEVRFHIVKVIVIIVIVIVFIMDVSEIFYS